MNPTAESALTFLDRMLQSVGLCSGPCGNGVPEWQHALTPVEVLRQEVLFLRGYCGAPTDLTVPLDQYSSKPWPAAEAKVDINLDVEKWAALVGERAKPLLDELKREIDTRVAALAFKTAQDAELAALQEGSFTNGLKPKAIITMPREMEFLKVPVVATDRLTREQACKLSETIKGGVGEDWDGTFKPIDQLSYVPPSRNEVREREGVKPVLTPEQRAKLVEMVKAEYRKPPEEDAKIEPHMTGVVRDGETLTCESLGQVRRWTGGAGNTDLMDPRNWEPSPLALRMPSPMTMTVIDDPEAGISPAFVRAANVEADTPVVAYRPPTGALGGPIMVMKDVAVKLGDQTVQAKTLEVDEAPPDVVVPAWAEEQFAAKLAEYQTRHPQCEGGCGTPTDKLVQVGTRLETMGRLLSMGPDGIWVRRFRCPACKRPAVAAVDPKDAPPAAS